MSTHCSSLHADCTNIYIGKTIRAKARVRKTLSLGAQIQTWPIMHLRPELGTIDQGEGQVFRGFVGSVSRLAASWELRKSNLKLRSLFKGDKTAHRPYRKIA